MCKTMKEVCKEKHLRWTNEGYPLTPCAECIFDKNLNGHWGDCDFIIAKTNNKLPSELEADMIDLLLNSTTDIERINYLNENWQAIK